MTAAGSAQTLIDAQENVGKDNPFPAWWQITGSGTGKTNQPTNDQEPFAAKTGSALRPAK